MIPERSTVHLRTQRLARLRHQVIVAARDLVDALESHTETEADFTALAVAIRQHDIAEGRA